jgi:hypothetical protein
MNKASTKQDILLFVGILIVGLLFLLVAVYFNGSRDLQTAGLSVPETKRCSIDEEC